MNLALVPPPPVDDARAAELAASVADLLPELGDLRPVYRRDKPGSGSLVGLATVGEGTPVGYVRVFEGRASSEVEAWADKTRACAPVRDRRDLGSLVLPGGSAVAVVLPADHRLRSLPRLLELRRLKRHLGPALGQRMRAGRSVVRVRSHRPERRVVVEVDAALEDGTTRRLFLRLDRVGRHRAVGQVARAWRAAGVRAVGPIGTMLAGAVGIEPAVAGHDLAERLPDASPRAAAGLAEEAWDLLAGLRAAPATGVAVGDDDAMRVVAELDQLVRRHGDLADVAPAVVERLAGGPEPGRLVSMHGDLHLGQLVGDESSLSLVDLDRVGIGAAERDLAMLVASSRVDGRGHPGAARFGAELAERTLAGPDLSPVAFGWYLRRALVGRALWLDRTFAPDARRRIREALEQAAATSVVAP